MKKSLLYSSFIALLLTLVLSSFTFSKTGSLYGKITEEGSNEGMIAANVILYQNGNIVQGTITDIDGNYKIDSIPVGTYDIEVSYLGYQTLRQTGLVIKADRRSRVNLSLSDEAEILSECVVVSKPNRLKRALAVFKRKDRNSKNEQYDMPAGVAPSHNPQQHRHNPHRPYEEEEIRIDHNEEYGEIVENSFIDPMDEALSTFSIDVDRAGYSNMRRFIDNGTMPPTDAIRIEEMINYFDYTYDQPDNEDPISLNSTLTECAWNEDHQLLHIGLQARDVDKKDLPPSNLVFLIDVSGSMNSHNKLPLVKASFKMLINNLRKEDRVAIVTYAGSAGIALESTSIKDKRKILGVVNSLGAGGSTAGAEGIRTAYEIAENNFMKEGNNRVILATDGDFNVGIRDADDLEKLIEKKRKTGVFLSVLGYGMGNYKDHKMQTLADKGNGNHAYIDNIQEARKIFISEFGGTLFTIAKDVKIQIEFNPAYVQAYRLVGYENRLLDKKDFNDDTKDAGEIGSGHVVTAIYEIVKTGSKSSIIGKVDDLKYQKTQKQERPEPGFSDELATIKFRYKQPDGDKSKKVVDVISPEMKSFKKCNDDLRFSVAVAEFGMLLRESAYVEQGSLEEVIKIASKAKGKDEEGYRAEFVRLVKSVRDMSNDLAQKE